MPRMRNSIFETVTREAFGMSYLTAKRRQIRTDPLYDDETGEQIGWYTKGADWYIARGQRTKHGTSYSYYGLRKREGIQNQERDRRAASATRKERRKMNLPRVSVTTTSGNSIDIRFRLDQNTGKVVSTINGACYCSECNTPSGEGRNLSEALDAILDQLEEVSPEEQDRAVTELKKETAEMNTVPTFRKQIERTIDLQYSVRSRQIDYPGLVRILVAILKAQEFSSADRVELTKQAIEAYTRQGYFV